MKKFLSLFAFVAIVLTFAACGGNDGNVPGGEEPKVQNFQFKIEMRPTKMKFIVTPANYSKKYFWWYAPVERDVEPTGSLKNYVEKYMAQHDYAYWRDKNMILNGKDEYTDDMYPNLKYVVYACYVEKGEDGYAEIVGDIEYKEFVTVPEFTLGGEFTVNNEGKKVHFRSGNLYLSEGFHYNHSHQYDYNTDGSDYFKWPTASSYTLSADEWYYLFRGRDRADELFAPGTVKDVHGLIILPDNWQRPDDIIFKTAKGLNFSWLEDQKRYLAPSSLNGYEENKYTENDWIKMEFAGAVFLPAEGYYGVANNIYGWYWSSTANAGNGEMAGAFSFATNNLILDILVYRNRPKTSLYSVRSFLEVK